MVLEILEGFFELEPDYDFDLPEEIAELREEQRRLEKDFYNSYLSTPSGSLINPHDSHLGSAFVIERKRAVEEKLEQ